MPRRRIGAAGTARWFGRLAAAEQIDRTLERSCIGRIVSMVILITMIACIGLWVGIAWLVNKAGLSSVASQLPGPVFPCLFFGGLILCIVIGGLVGNWLRRLAWRVILRFWR